MEIRPIMNYEVLIDGKSAGLGHSLTDCENILHEHFGCLGIKRVDMKLDERMTIYCPGESGQSWEIFVNYLRHVS